MRTVGFRTIPDEPLRAVIIGAGEMGRVWLDTVHESPDVTLAGVVDLDGTRAREAAGLLGEPVPSGTDIADVVANARANVVINVTTPAAHLPVTLECLAAGLPVLGEKPLASTVAEAFQLVAASEAAAELFMVSQSRRYNRQLPPFKRDLEALGSVGILATEFYKAPRFGGYRDEMAHPLLLDYAIHPFDTARWLMGADPVSVLCDEHNPPWSWYAGDAAATAVFDMGDQRRYVFTGSWCSAEAETSWNGAWRASASGGTALWDGDNVHAVQGATTTEAPDTDEVPGEGTVGALADFVRALRTGRRPMGHVHDNLMSLAMVSAAIEAATLGTRVHISHVLETALADARDAAPRHVRDAMAPWRDANDALHVKLAAGQPS